MKPAKQTPFAFLLLTASLLFPRPLAAAELSSEAIERESIAILLSTAPPADKAIPCKRLAVHGTEKAVPALAPLLADPELASWARIALEAIPGPAADEALLQAAGRLEGRLLIGVANSLGVRRVEKAVPTLVQQLSRSDESLASAAAVALGRIGNTEATRALLSSLTVTSARVRDAVAEGCVLVVEQQLKTERHAEALALSKAVLAAEVPEQRHREATRGMILALGSDGLPELAKLLRSDDRRLFGLGLHLAREIPGPATAGILAGECKVAGIPRRGYLLLALAERGDEEAVPVAMEMAARGDTPSRLLAIGVLDRLADRRSIDTLIRIAFEPEDASSRAARQVVARWPGKEIDRAVLALVKDPEPGTRSMAIDLAVQRRVDDLLPALYRAAVDPDEAVRTASLKALGAVATVDDIGRLVDLLVNSGSPAEIRGAKSAVIAVSKRHARVAPGAVQVVKAAYGSLPGGNSRDVTKKVRDIVASGASEIEASNDHFGDPAPGVVKHLQVDYLVAGITESKLVPEGGVLKLSATTVPPEAIAAVAGALSTTVSSVKLALLDILGEFGGPTALKAIRAATADPSAEIREGALRSLFDWPTVDALPDLARLAREAPTPGFKMLALRGYTRLVQAQDAPPEQKLKSLQEAWSLAERDQEKRQILAAYGSVPTLESLALVEPHLDSPSFKEEAAAAVISMARTLQGSRPPQFTRALEKAVKATDHEQTRQQARELLK